MKAHPVLTKRLSCPKFLRKFFILHYFLNHPSSIILIRLAIFKKPC
ncbi:MAG: hypothetical protein WBA71_04615 [Candidatus Humimicrobiia bacterium]